MSREFKFRYANEIAGVFVISAAVLLVLGIFFAGRSQGWFASRITLIIVFDTPEGSFGLQEGAPVLVRNTQAGRVVSLDPTEDGQIRGTLRIREQFRGFLTKESSARVKRKFGVAGDAFVELVPGVGPMIEDGDILPVVKDEELLEMAQRILAEVQEAVLPVVIHVETIISNTASILTRIEKGEGIAGAAISDMALRDHVKGILANAEGMTQEVEDMMGHISGMLTNEIRQVVGRTVQLQRELERTVVESRRVVEAFQRHWLIRKYVESERERLPLVPGDAVWQADEQIADQLDEKLRAARERDDAAEVALAAYNRAVYALSVGSVDTAEALLQEALLALRRVERATPAGILLLQAEVNRVQGRKAMAAEGAAAVLAEAEKAGRKGRDAALQSHVLLLAVALDAGQMDQARGHFAAIQRIKSRVEMDSVVRSGLLGLEARYLFAEGREREAAQRYLQQADMLREHGALLPMTLALRRAGDLFSNAGQAQRAVEAYLRAVSSLLAQGQREPVLHLLSAAGLVAEKLEDPLLLKRLGTLSEQAQNL